MTANDLQAAMAALPEPPAHSAPPQWDYWRHDLWTRVSHGQPPDDFTLWPCIYHTMLHDHWRNSVLCEYRQWRDGEPDEAHDLLIYPPWADMSESAATSHYYNALVTYCRFRKWELMTARSLASLPCIIEFGAGYGMAALIARRMGFAGRYIITDLPEFRLLQQWFLERAGADGVEWWEWEWGAATPDKPPVSCDLLLAAYSLSETPQALRKAFLHSVYPASCLFVYSNCFADYDNLAFFQPAPRELATMHWQHERLDCFPPESWLSVGQQ